MTFSGGNLLSVAATDAPKQVAVLCFGRFHQGSFQHLTPTSGTAKPSGFSSFEERVSLRYQCGAARCSDDDVAGASLCAKILS
jgi:hypothetical protein